MTAPGAGRQAVGQASSPGVLRATWRLLAATGSSWVADYAPSMGAALAYYTLFSIAPLLLIVISVAGLLFGEAAARGEIFDQLSQTIGADSAQMISLVLESLNQPRSGVLGTLFGLLALLVGATTVFAELQDAMDRIWRAPARTEGSGLWRLLRTRLLSLGMVLGVGFLLTVSLVFSAAMAAIGKWWAPWFGEMALVADSVNFALSLAFVTAVFAMIYKWMPRVTVAWRDVWIGAFITALLFTVGKTLIGQYIGRSGVASVFGAAAALVVLLVWLYYSAQVFLLGAEFTCEFARRHGSLRDPAAPAAADPAPRPPPAGPAPKATTTAA